MKDTKSLNRMKNEIEYLKEGEQLVHDIVYIFGGYEAFCRLIEENSVHAHESPELLRRVKDFVGYVDYTEIER